LDDKIISIVELFYQLGTESYWIISPLAVHYALTATCGARSRSRWE